MKAEHEKAINSAVFPGLQGGPLMHVIAAKATAFKEAQEPSFINYQKQVISNAKALAETLISRGLRIVSGGTDNHLLLIDLTDKNITGKEADFVLDKANITVNKNTIPNDPRSPFVTSGLRLGTPAVTTRGFKEKEMILLTNWIADILDDVSHEETIAKVKEQVLLLCREFPVYR
jgi:glycine hydroxymethyltransferase